MSQARLCELLVRASLIPEASIREALTDHRCTGARLCEILVVREIVDESALYDALSAIAGMDRLVLSGLVLDRAQSTLVDREWVARNAAVPLYLDPSTGELVVAISDPTEIAPLEELSRLAGAEVRPLLATERELRQLRGELYSRGPANRTGRGSSSPAPPARARPERISSEPTVDPDTLRPHPSKGAGVPVARVEEAHETASRELQVLLDLCLEKSLFSRQEYLERLD